MPTRRDGLILPNNRYETRRDLSLRLNLNLNLVFDGNNYLVESRYIQKSVVHQGLTE